MDLLRVSWASEAVHKVLTDASSRLVWIAAFGHILKPRRPHPYPVDLTEIAYADLLYNPRCMVRVRVRSFVSLVHLHERDWHVLLG